MNLNLHLPDQLARDRFVTETSRHFSVIAPAGVGKTRALVERILHLAKSAEAVQLLPRLVLVTYSVRAAREMQIRAKAAVQGARLPVGVQRAFDQVFFGTIHSYCLRLLERFGDRLGLTARWSLLDGHEEAELWQLFLNSTELQAIGERLQERERIFRFVPLDFVYNFARTLAPGSVPERASEPKMKLGILDYRSQAAPSTRAAVERKIAALKDWTSAVREKRGWNPLPEAPTFKDPYFCQLWDETLGPVHDWVRQNVLGYARLIANAFAEYRLQRGFLTYDDQVRQALRVLELPEVQEELQQDQPILLLDEAQDTDRDQFQVLLRAAGWRGTSNLTPDQTLCVVGDFQQSIYGPRAKSQDYRAVHDEMVADARGEEAVFRVTFRCDEAIISFVNEIFPHVLSDSNGQCAFVPLLARPDVKPGQAYRWKCPPLPENAPQPAGHYIAEKLAAYLKKLGLPALRATSWSQVAVLCPRVSWLDELAEAFLKVGLPVQLHSSREKRADQPAHLWLTSLMWIMAHPEDSYEVAGVLREIFGFSDHDLAHFTEGVGDLLRLDLEPAKEMRRSSSNATSATPKAPEIHQTLVHLRYLSQKMASLPLHRAVRELVQQTRLHERLELLELDAELQLQPLLAEMLDRSVVGTTLTEAADQMRQSLETGSERDDEIQNAVQFLTSYKAKGLEWQAVVLPFLFRKISMKPAPYPRFITSADGQESLQLTAPSKFAESPPTAEEIAEQQNFERLMYVACTRAKQTLLLVDDEEVWEGQKKKRGGWTSAGLLQINTAEANRPIWEQLPTEPAPLEPAPLIRRALTAQEELSFSDGPPPDRLRPLSWAEVQPAIALAKDFPSRITPHSLAVHPKGHAHPPEPVEEYEPANVQLETELASVGPGLAAETVSSVPGGNATDNNATKYGLWWHESAQFSPWSDGPEAVAAHWDRVLQLCPQPERGLFEWQQLQSSSVLAWLLEPGRLHRSELPFLWAEKEKLWLEGIIDLVAFEPDERCWHVIDWKTNRDPNPALLKEQYRGQIEAYCRAIHAIFRAPVLGSLYLTGNGQWLRVCQVGLDL